MLPEDIVGKTKRDEMVRSKFADEA